MSQSNIGGQNRPVVLINTFTPKPGKLDEFIAAQTTALRGFRGRVPGWRQSRLHRALDGNTVVMISVFDSVDDHRRWQETGLFAEHREKIRQLVERVDPGFYEVVYEAENV